MPRARRDRDHGAGRPWPFDPHPRGLDQVAFDHLEAMTTVSCPHCQQYFEVELQCFAQDLECSVCQGEFEIPAAPAFSTRPTLITPAPTPVSNALVDLNQSIDPYAAPRSGFAVPQVAEPIYHTGMGRGIFVVLLFAVLVLPIAFAAVAAQGGITGIIILIGVTVLLWLYPFAKRFENMGYHSAFCLLMFIPIVSMFVLLACLILPKGFSQNKRIDIFGIVMIVLIVGLIGLLISAGRS